MEGEVSILVDAVGISMHPIEFRSLALQYNLRTSQGVMNGHVGQGFCGDGQIPMHARHTLKKA